MRQRGVEQLCSTTEMLNSNQRRISRWHAAKTMCYGLQPTDLAQSAFLKSTATATTSFCGFVDRKILAKVSIHVIHERCCACSTNLKSNQSEPMFNYLQHRMRLEERMYHHPSFSCINHCFCIIPYTMARSRYVDRTLDVVMFSLLVGVKHRDYSIAFDSARFRSVLTRYPGVSRSILNIQDFPYIARVDLYKVLFTCTEMEYCIILAS